MKHCTAMAVIVGVDTEDDADSSGLAETFSKVYLKRSVSSLIASIVIS